MNGRWSDSNQKSISCNNQSKTIFNFALTIIVFAFYCHRILFYIFNFIFSFLLLHRCRWFCASLVKVCEVNWKIKLKLKCINWTVKFHKSVWKIIWACANEHNVSGQEEEDEQDQWINCQRFKLVLSRQSEFQVEFNNTYILHAKIISCTPAGVLNKVGMTWMSATLNDIDIEYVLGQENISVFN